MPKRQITPTYILFYILFLPDSWRILVGVIAAVFLTPLLLKPEMTAAGHTMLFMMIAAIGYTASGMPARKFSRFLRKLVLGDQLS